VGQRCSLTHLGCMAQVSEEGHGAGIRGLRPWAMVVDFDARLDDGRSDTVGCKGESQIRSRGTAAGDCHGGVLGEVLDSIVDAHAGKSNSQVSRRGWLAIAVLLI